MATRRSRVLRLRQRKPTVGRFRNGSATPPTDEESRALDRTWTITELAEEHGITLRTLRHYEDVGLLTPERRGTTRVFHQRDRIRLRLILRGKRLGFSLPAIATIVNMYDEQPGEAGQLRYLLEQIEVRRDELDQMRRDIEETMTELDRVAARCHEDLARLE